MRAIGRFYLSLPAGCDQVQKQVKISLNAGLITNLVVGIWHFMIPFQFQWFSSIDPSYRSLVNSIKLISILFSYYTTFHSVFLLLFQDYLPRKDPLGFTFFCMPVGIWIVRIIIMIVFPFNGTWDIMAWGLLLVFSSVLVTLLFPLLAFIEEWRARNRPPPV